MSGGVNTPWRPPGVPAYFHVMKGLFHNGGSACPECFRGQRAIAEADYGLEQNRK
jgi:hypothetical protein